MEWVHSLADFYIKSIVQTHIVQGATVLTALDNFQNFLKPGLRGNKDEVSISELKADQSQRDGSPYQRPENQEFSWQNHEPIKGKWINVHFTRIATGRRPISGRYCSDLLSG